MQTKRITANLPAELLEQAMAATGLSITDTLVAGLEAICRHSAFEEAKRLKGKLHLKEDGGRKNGSSSN